MSSETLDERFHADLAAYAKANPDSLDDDGNLLPPSQDEFSLEWAWKQLRKAESELSRLQQENDELRGELKALREQIQQAIDIIPASMGGHVTLGLNILQAAFRGPGPEGGK